MSRRIFIRISVLLLLGLWLASCGEYQLNWAPPLLINTAGLEQQVTLDPKTLPFGTDRAASFSKDRPFSGHIFATAGDATIGMAVRANDVDAAPAVALYGPRMYNGLFGAPITYNLPKRGVQAVLWDVSLNQTGDYLILVKNVAGAMGDYLVQVDCSLGCDKAPCEPMPCGGYCATGFQRNNQGCPSECICNTGCAADNDCPQGYACKNGVCQKEDPCPQCKNESYQPVCGVDRNTYANACELDCTGVALAHQGTCGQNLCTNNADCPAGMQCENGVCAAACDCSGEPYDPVCGTDRVTYHNDCERQCTGVGLDHVGECESCNPEICDGRDNDCDGLIDEGVCRECASDADCVQGEACLNETCVKLLPCNTDTDCPAGQVCQNGLCRLDDGCEPEVCDGRDNDCDGQIDEGCPPQCQNDSDCAVGQACCSGTCTNTASDSNNCGGCGTVCDDGDPNTSDYCENGSCYHEWYCRTDADCDDGDPNTVDKCVNGTCVHRDVCRTDNDCEAGYICQQGECVIPCRTDSDCPQDETCQGGICAP